MKQNKKWKVLISAPYFQPVLEQYRSFFEQHDIELVVPIVHERLSENELLQYINNIDGVICGDDRFTAHVLEQAVRLKVISKWGTGIDSIDLNAARQRGIAVKNTPNAFTDPVADTVLGYLLSFARQIPWMDANVKDGIWNKRPGVALTESTLGIIGIGNIGQAVARRAHACGMRILGYDVREVPTSVIQEYEIVIVPLEDLLTESDFITLHCDLNPTTHHLIGSRQLNIMKPSSYLINTARGPLVDEVALVDALRSKKIAGAALDVFEVEPLPADSALRGFSNVLLAPHNANSSPSAWKRVHQNTIKNLLEVLENKD